MAMLKALVTKKETQRDNRRGVRCMMDMEGTTNDAWSNWKGE